MEPRTAGWQELRPGVHRRVLEPASVNVGLVVGDDGVLLVDTGSSPAQGRELAESVLALTGRPITHVVVTHHHWDHFWGVAGVLEVFGDAEVVAHESVVPPHLDDPAAQEQARQLGVDLATLVPATTTISLARGFNLGGVRAEAVHLGPAHTPGDLLVVVAQARVAFTGDLYETSGPPSFGPDSTVESWPSVLDGALAGAKDDTLVVPGHGDPTGPFDAFRQRAEISMLFGATERLVGRGVRLEQALAALDDPVDEQGRPHAGASEWEWPFPVDTIRQVLPLCYAELKAQGTEPRRMLPLA